MRLAALALLSSTHAQRLVLNEYTDVGEQDLDYSDLDEALEEYTDDLAADSGDAFNWALYVQALHAGLKTRNTSILGRPSAFIDAGRGPFGPQEHLAKEVFFARIEGEETEVGLTNFVTQVMKRHEDFDERKALFVPPVVRTGRLEKARLHPYNVTLWKLRTDIPYFHVLADGLCVEPGQMVARDFPAHGAGSSIWELFQQDPSRFRSHSWENEHRSQYDRMKSEPRIKKLQQLHDDFVEEIGHAHIQARVAIIEAFDRALLNANVSDRRVAEANLVAFAHAMGYFSTEEEPTPHDWQPKYLMPHLRDDLVVEGWVLAKMDLGVRSVSTEGVHGIGWRLGRQFHDIAEDDPAIYSGGSSIWRSINASLFSRRLCNLGLVRWVDAYGGLADGKPAWMSWPKFASYYGAHRAAARVAKRGDTDYLDRVAAEYKRVIKALETGDGPRGGEPMRWLRWFGDIQGDEIPKHEWELSPDWEDLHPNADWEEVEASIEKVRAWRKAKEAREAHDEL